MTEFAQVPAIAPTSNRRPWLAFVLGLMFPGLGHLYVGAPWRGLVALAALCLLILPGGRIVMVALSWSPTAVVSGILVAALLPLLVPLDSALVARRRQREPRGRCNRIWIYAVYAVLVSQLLIVVNRWLFDHFWFKTFRVPSTSMAPALLPGDYVLADMRPRAISAIQFGDVIVFRSPRDADVILTKRVMGMPGQTVEIRRGLLQVDGQVLDELEQTDGVPQRRGAADAGQFETTHSSNESFGPVTVPQGAFLVLGDNRNRSTDSRLWGPIKKDLVCGRVYKIYASRDPASGHLRWQRFGKTVSRE